MKSVAALTGFLTLFACSGCTVAVPAVSSAVGSVPVVEQHFDQGQGDSFWIARHNDVVTAALRAGDKLALTLTNKRIEKETAHLEMHDDKDAVIILDIERRTDTVTRVHFNAGSHKYIGLARLLAQQTAHELKDANAFVVDWTDGTS